jgi:hypothetical protein
VCRLSIASLAARCAVLTFAGAILLGAGAAQAAATFHVTTAGDPATGTSCPSVNSCSLRQAVSQAVDGGTIDVPAFHIHLASPLSINQSITINGSGADSTILDGDGVHRVISVIGPAPSFPESNASLTLEHLSVTGGAVTRTNEVHLAGGSGIQNNSFGALHLVGVSVTNNTFTASSALSSGGAGIFSLSTVDLTASSVTNNDLTVNAASGSTGGGGVYVSSGDLILASTVVSNNTATLTEGSTSPGGDGGGGAFLGADGGDDVILESSTLAGNTVHVLGTEVSGDGGGALYQAGAVSILSSGSTLSGNVADIGATEDDAGGGAVFDAGGGSEYNNTTFANNRVRATAPATSDGGGAILSASDISSFANDTFSGNSPGPGSGANIYDFGTRVIVKDTILSEGSSPAANCAQDSSSPGTVISDGYNLYDDAADSCGLTGLGDLHAATPELGPLASNGGGLQTEALLATSPAVNAGNPQSCTDSFGRPLATDARSVLRPQPAGGRCDIGAYERAPAIASTGLAGAVGRGTATLQGTAADPDAVAGTWFFQYGRTAAYGATTPVKPLAARTTAPESTVLSGLAPGTYHCRLVVADPDGTSHGLDSTFVVPRVARPPAPAVLTGPAKSVGATRAKLTGEIDGFGAATKYRFQFGRTRGYGSKTRLKSAGSRNRVLSISALVRGLKPGHAYHYRLVAISSSGRTVGPNQTFTTRSVHKHGIS